MPVVRASSSAVIRAPARVVYGLLADYQGGHPRILPPRYFPWLKVERGGVGAGTVIRFKMRAFGATREIQSVITEPEPGRTLVETDQGSGARTRFTVLEEVAGETCRVEIETVWEAKGVRGWIEQMTAPPFLRRVYQEELTSLAALAEGKPDAQGRGPA